ncbi:MAG: hypothetical protein K1X28_07665 [Parachlamydiales bacterium]|nr:hypothetical protein [Parachlamydiales bacterium]
MRLLFLLWSVQVFAAYNLTWGMPALSLDTNPPIGDTDSNAYIAMDPMGNAVATWSRTTGKGASENIWAAVYNHSQRVWTGAVRISGGGSASNSQTAVDSTGNAIFVWEEGFPTRICFRILSSDGVWTPDPSMPPAVVHSSKNAQTFPQIAVDSNGNALAIWNEFFGGINHIFSAKKPFGMSWIDLGEIATGLQDTSLIPSKALAMNPSGDALAVWLENKQEVHMAHFLMGEWHEPMIVAQNNATSPSICIDREGDGVIVWSQNHAILSKRFQKGKLSDAPLVISHPDYVAERPSVGMDASGNAVVVYERYNSMHKFIVGANLNKTASSWTKPLDISAPSPSDANAAGYPVFSMNAIGDGVAIWKEWTGTNMVIQGAGFSLGTWSSIRTLSSPSGDAGSPSPAYDIFVTLNEAGNILAIWPEDPFKNGAQQIKATAGAGLANIGPLPPIVVPATIMKGVVTGMQMKHRFPAHIDLINVLTWESPGSVHHFNVYRKNLSSFIGMTNEPRFEDHQRVPKEIETYLITSVDHNGQESGPITIVVNPL